MSLDPFGAGLFVFCNNNRSIIKCVYWEGNGFALWMKRLEKARFQWPTRLSMDVIDLSAQQVNIIDGCYRSQRTTSELARRWLRFNVIAWSRNVTASHSFVVRLWLLNAIITVR